MAEQIRKQRTATKKDDAPGAEEGLGAKDRAAALKAELDELLDEIDEVLETNAEEFVKNYVQKGGE